jgi:hypothetical protein
VLFVSPFTQYFVRKLLRRHLIEPQFLMPSLKVADLDQADLAQVLRCLCPSDRHFQRQLYELESLIEAHSRLGSSQRATDPSIQQAELDKIELQIYRILGLRLMNLLPNRLPQVLSEDDCQRFQFCLKQSLHTGILHRSQFYGLLQEWPIQARLQAYRTAWTIAQRGEICLITQADPTFAVWIHLKSPAAIVLLESGHTILPTLLKLGTIVQRGQYRKINLIQAA